MLTLDMLFAVLHGLPANHLDYLDRPWYLLASRIERALKEGQDPYSALRSALSNSPEWERQVYLRAFLQEEPVMALTDLTPRQKDALIALRYAGACSLPQLSRILVLDRSYTRRLLEVLIEKGYAIKYFRRDGTYYLAISSPMSSQARSQVTELMQAFKQALLAKQVSSADKKAFQAVDVPYPAEPNASPTLRRKGTSNATGVFPVAKSPESSESHKSRMSQESPASPKSSVSSKSSESCQSAESLEVRVDVPYSALPSRNSNASASFADANPKSPVSSK